MKYHKFKLKNGLRVVLAPIQGTGTVTVLIQAGTGSRYETRRENGLSHFLEHMFFKGTEKRPTALDISKELDAVGAEYNAYTSKDRTGYWAKVDARHADIALDVVSDIFLHAKLEKEEIDRERGPILQEFNMYEDTPYRKVGEVFENLLYGDTPLGWDIIGPKDNIRSFRRRDFIRYWNRAYVANNIVVGVAGKFDPKKMRKLIERTFAHVKRGKLPVRKKIVERQKAPALLVKHKKTDQTHMVVGVRTFDWNHKDRYALAVLATLLGGGMSSRLFMAVRERRGLAYSVHTGVEHYHDAGYLATQVGVEHENLEKTLAVILDEYRRIRDELVPADELAKAKEHIKGATVMHLESSDEMASYLVDQETLKGSIVLPAERFKKIDAVTARDIRRVAKEIFVPERLNLSVIGPHAETDRLKKLLTL